MTQDPTCQGLTDPSGFALAVQPLAASAITTSSDQLEAEEIKIPTSQGEIPAYRALPKKRGSQLPLLLVVHEIFGVHEHIKDVCRRLAQKGFCAVAPELFARYGDVSKLTEIKEISSKVVSKVPDREVLADLDSTVAWAKQDTRIDTRRLGITGFCWGGRIVWLYAAHNPELKAGVAWYGRLTGDRDQLHPEFPVDVVGRLQAPVLGLYGGKDTGIPLQSVEEMRAALHASANPRARGSEIRVYPEAGHAFFADYRPSYHKDSAEDGYKRLLNWMKKHRVG